MALPLWLEPIQYSLRPVPPARFVRGDRKRPLHAMLVRRSIHSQLHQPSNPKPNSNSNPNPNAMMPCHKPASLESNDMTSGNVVTLVALPEGTPLASLPPFFVQFVNSRCTSLKDTGLVM